MTDFKGKTKQFLEEKAEQAIDKIEKTPSKKLALFTLVVVSIGVFVLGYFQLQKNLKAPLLASQLQETKAVISKKYPAYDANRIIQEYTNSISSAGQKNPAGELINDIDSDGLSNNDEQNIYHTSPYLADSDSDGISDYDEVKNGTNPLCAEGQTCESDSGQEGVPTDKVPAIPSILNLPANLNVNDPQAMLEYEMEMIKTGNFAALGITDPAQQETFKQLLAAQAAQAQADAANGNINANSNTNNINSSGANNLTDEQKVQFKQAISQMTPAQIREMLAANGYDQATLDQLSDEQLQQAISKSLEKL